MHRDLCAYLQDVLDASESISTFTIGVNYETFRSTDIILSAVTQKLEVTGEALKQASRYFPGPIESLPEAMSAIKMRDRLAHGYFFINPSVLWDTIKEDLPKLVEEVRRLKSQHCA
jgi:uncharacterized protein with HEPN domain